MTENEMKLDEPATRRDLRELKAELINTEFKNHPTRRDLRDALANHPTHAQLDASLRQVMLHIEATVAQHVNASLEAVRDMFRSLDDQYRDPAGARDEARGRGVFAAAEAQSRLERRS